MPCLLRIQIAIMAHMIQAATSKNTNPGISHNTVTIAEMLDRKSDPSTKNQFKTSWDFFDSTTASKKVIMTGSVRAAAQQDDPDGAHDDLEVKPDGVVLKII